MPNLTTIGGRGRLRGTEAAPLLGCPTSAEEAAEMEETVKGMAKYETMDLELRNSPLAQAIRSHQPRHVYLQAMVARWVIVLSAGVAIGVVAFFFNWAIRGLWLAMYRTTERVIYNHEGFGPAYGTYMAFTLVYAALSTFPVTMIASGGLADGGGISELKAHFNGIYTKGMLGFRPALAQTVSGVFINAANLIGVGEAPLVHAAAAIAGQLSQPLKMPFVGERLRRWHILRRLTALFDNEKDHRDFVSQGASAGFTMAFITPIAGTLFPAEEGGLAFAPTRLFMALMSSCTAMLALMISVTLYKQPGSFWEYRMFDVLYPATTNITGRLFYVYIWELPIFVVMAVICGMAGALFVALNIRLRHLRSRFMPWDTPKHWWRSVEVMLIAVVTATIWIGICYASPCKQMPPQQYQAALRAQYIPNSLLQLASRVTEPYPQLWCAEGQYSVWGTVFWAPVQTLTRILIGLTESDSDPSIVPPNVAHHYIDNGALVMFMFVQYVLVTWTYGSAIAFGAFTPSITVGAALGQLTGHLVRSIAAELNPAIQVALPTYAIIGGAAMLSGFVRYRLVAVVLMAELSGAITLVPVIAVACAIATLVGNLFGHGIYDTYNQDNKAPMLSDPATDADLSIVADRLQVQDVMAPNLVSLLPVAQIGDIIATLRDTPHQSYPLSLARPDKPASSVIDMHGVISRKALLSLLKHREQFYTHKSDAETGGGLRSMLSDDSTLPDWTDHDRIDLMSRVRPFASSAYVDEGPIFSAVPKQEYHMELDLRPFAHVAPVVLPHHASALQAYHIFRHLGCHEIFVTPHTHQAYGIISRKDITVTNGRLMLWRKLQQQQESGQSVETDAASLRQRFSSGDNSSGTGTPGVPQAVQNGKPPFSSPVDLTGSSGEDQRQRYGPDMATRRQQQHSIINGRPSQAYRAEV